MKKLTLLLVSALIIIAFSGCSVDFNLADAVEGYISYANAGEKTEKLCSDIYAAFAERNADKLEVLFSQKTAETHKLRDEIAKAFELIDGNIISYDKMNTDVPNGSFHYVSDTYSQFVCLNTVWGIKTDTGAVYGIRIIHCLNYKGDESYNGIFKLKIIIGTDYDGEELCSIGEVTEIYEPQALVTEYQTVDESVRIGIVHEYGRVAILNTALALQNRDAERLCSLFSEEMQGDELNKQVQAAIAFIDGDIVSYSRCNSDYHGESVDHGETTYSSGYAEMYDILTTGGKMYEIELYSDFIDKDHPESVGLYFLEIREVEPIADDTEHKQIEKIVVKALDKT